MTIHQLSTEGVEIYKGESKTFLLTVLDGDRNPIDLAGSEITLTVRPEICDDRVSITKYSVYPAQIEFISPTANGQAYVHFKPIDTEDLDHGTYVYDVWIKLTNDKEIVVIEPSPFEIMPPVTEILGGQEEEEHSNISFNDLITTATMNIYVRAITGNDNNAGTITAPLKTLAAAEAKIPYIVEHDVIIHTGLHTGYGYEWPIFRERCGSGRIWVVGDGGGAPGDDGFTEVVASTAALAGSTADVIKSSGLDATKRGGAGALLGLTVEVLDGAAEGDRRDIAYNTATDIVPVAPFSAVVATGDHYRIVKPSVHVNTAWKDPENTNGKYIARGSAKLYLVNLFMDSSEVGYGNLLSAPDCHIVLFGVKSDQDITWFSPNLEIEAGNESTDFSYTDYSKCGSSIAVSVLGARQTSSWYGWGLANLCESTWYCYIWLSDIKGQGFFSCGALYLSEAASVQFIGGIAWYHHTASRGSKSWVGSYWTRAIIGTNQAPPGSGAAVFVAGELVFGSVLRKSWIGLPTTNGPARGMMVSSTGVATIYADYVSFKCSGNGMRTKLGGKILIMNSLAMDCGGNDFSEDNGAHWHPISDLGVGDVYADAIHGLIYREY
jgi:uncharacterized protein (DUF736 family)